MRFEIEKRLSKRDRVYLALTDDGQKVVLKKYDNRAEKNIETDILNQLSVSGYAPKIIQQDDNSIVYEYIEGETLADKYERYTMSDDVEGLVRLANELSIYLQIFNAIADGYIINDINFANFIIKDGRCYGVDYDSVNTGMQYTDIAKVVAYAATHAVGSIMASFPFIRQLLKNFRLEMLDVINDVKYALEDKAKDMVGGIDIDYILSILLDIDRLSEVAEG